MTYSIWYAVRKTFHEDTHHLRSFNILIVLFCNFFLRFSLSWTTLIFAELPESVSSGDQLVLMKISGNV
jgi:hypothetical protein